MASVTGRISAIKQPKGGYIKPSDFDTFIFDDGISLNTEENVHSSVIGMAVDYLTRYIMGADSDEAFKISLQGAMVAESLGLKKATSVA